MASPNESGSMKSMHASRGAIEWRLREGLVWSKRSGMVGAFSSSRAADAIRQTATMGSGQSPKIGGIHPFVEAM